MPKISCSSCPSRAVLREPQMVEQLEKVPTILYFLKQAVDIPVPRFGVGGSQGFLPGQGSASSVEEIVHTPAGRGVSGGLQGFLQDRVRLLWSRPFTLQQVVDFLGVFKVFSRTGFVFCGADRSHSSRSLSFWESSRFSFIQDKVRYSVLWSRSLTLQFQAATFKIFLLILVRQLIPMVCLESCLKGFFALYPV